MAGRTVRFWERFSTREALFIGFCATFVVLGRAALRLHLHVPGHAAATLTFFLLLARACVPRFGAATLAGSIAGVLVALLGLGSGGPLLVLRLLVPGLLIDLGAALAPRFATRPLTCAVIAAVAGSTRGLVFAPLEFAIGVNPELALAHALASAAGGAAFGALGGALVPSVYRRLAAHQLLPGPGTDESTDAALR